MSKRVVDPWPPTDAKPGDLWGAFRLGADGWWRLDTPGHQRQRGGIKLGAPGQDMACPAPSPSLSKSHNSDKPAK